ncbi:mandelate racemase/muconate lactonizing enzyme family protein (plasmid) [Haloferax prahovense]|uniref:mandelate racemase/muconate lactonizing enzyme family protein n=1 Tax=Haloferax prahovense TaxID=381852 RepID=UPI003C740114
MQIESVDSFAVRIPLDSDVSFSNRTLEERDHAIVRITTDDGVEGTGFTLGYDSAEIIADAVERLLTPILLGEDPNDTERLWREMFDGTVPIGRKGLLLRAISIVDIALWDIKAKAANQPLYKLLGAYTDEVPAYASGGYYRDEKGIDGLIEEMEKYVAHGHDRVKMKVGRESVKREVERVKAAREVIGPDRTLMLDANGKWKNKQEAVNACRAFAEFDPYFIEEPVMPDSVELMSKVNESLDYPVAAGELEFSRYGFAELLREGAVDIIQPDVTVVGGVTEWMRIANWAAVKDISVAPHYNWELHVHLLAAIENGLWAEYFYRDLDVTVFDDVLEYPLKPSGGVFEVPNRAGHGVVLDKDKVDDFRSN